LGVLLGAALIGGLLGEMVRLPKVTSYLLVGLLLGPSALHVLAEDHLDILDPLGKLAMALVLFNIGCHFPLLHVRRILRRVLRISGGELGLTFLAVTLGLLVVGKATGHSLWWQTALLFGALALATAPATTILVLRETESEGPITEYATALVVLNNLTCIIVFEVLFLLIDAVAGGAVLAGVAADFGLLAADLGGSVLLGVVAGLLISYGCALMGAGYWLVLLVAVCAFVLGACETFGIPYLLAFLAMGATLANASDLERNILAELDRLTGLLCVVFFVIHGAEMNLHALWQAGTVGVAYIVLRSAGKYFGALLGTGRQEEPPLRRWLGATLLSQAGAAIALSEIAVNRNPELGQHLQSIILGTVVFFEIVGPLLVRQAVIRTGEVPLAHAIRHTTTTPLQELSALWARLLAAAGLDPYRKKSPEQMTVQQLMRKNVQGVPWSATFDEIVAFLERSHDNTFAVVGDGGELAGVMSYADLRDSLFDPDLGGLVRAVDLAVPARHTLYPDEPIARAWELFAKATDDCIPVISREQPYRLLGMVKRRDMLRFFVRNPDNGGAAH
jgi:Kef-type K+ transport system membrane component KefB/CBS domain-containing protein